MGRGSAWSGGGGVGREASGRPARSFTARKTLVQDDGFGWGWDTRLADAGLRLGGGGGGVRRRGRFLSLRWCYGGEGTRAPAEAVLAGPQAGAEPDPSRRERRLFRMTNWWE